MISCPVCGSTKIQRRGLNDNKNSWRYQCRDDHEEFLDDVGNDHSWFLVPVEGKQDKIKSPKILFWDIENTGMLVENVWNLYEPRLNYSQVVRDSYLLSWSAKWIYDDKIYSDVLRPEEAKSGNDKRISKSLWEILDSADIIIAHNGDGHDVPKSSTRFLYYGFPPPSYDRTLDTYKIAKSTFSFPSNSLDNINKFLGLEQKMHNETGLWQKCMNGEKDALKSIEEYNKQDVVCLEQAYLKMLPWIKNHPNWTVYGESDGNTCPQCGKTGISWRDDKLNKGIYMVARCNNCGAPVRSKTNTKTKEQKKNVLQRI